MQTSVTSSLNTNRPWEEHNYNQCGSLCVGMCVCVLCFTIYFNFHKAHRVMVVCRCVCVCVFLVCVCGLRDVFLSVGKLSQ